MKVLEGHLTKNDKRTVGAMLEFDMVIATHRSNTYCITKNTDGTMTVNITTIDKGLIPVAGSPLRRSIYTAKISV